MKNVQSVKLSGKIDSAQTEIDRLLASGGGNIDLDFRDVTFISVEGLEWLEELLLRGESKKATIKLVNVPPTIYKVFKVAHIDAFLKACGGHAVSGPVC